QRIALRSQLSPLDLEETRGYISRRLQLAGANSHASEIFPSATVSQIYRQARGIPRLINTVCENALINAYARQLKSIPPEIIEEVAADLRLNVAPLLPAQKSLDNVDEFPSVRISTPQESRLVARTDKEGLAAEKFRFLAVRLRQMQQSRSLKKLLITSTRPEEGKSMVSANLAITLARKKRQKRLLLDGDLRRP